MSSSVSLALALVMLLSPTADAQTPANLTGTWSMVAERSESPHQTPPITSLVFDITHTDTALDVQATRNDETSRTTYQFDKTPNPTPGTTGIGAGTARAYWQGPRLVTEHAGNVQGETVSIKQTFDLSGDGSEMTVETMVVVQHGYTLRGARNYASKKDVFTKTR